MIGFCRANTALEDANLLNRGLNVALTQHSMKSLEENNVTL